MKIIREKPYWSVHTHSRYSNGDALSSVETIVNRVAELEQPGLAITDHGNIAASVELYKRCVKQGIKPFPGSELYFVPDIAAHRADRKNRDGQKASRYHLGVVAYTDEGYTHLVNLSTATHQNFFHKPLCDFAMLSSLYEAGKTRGLALTTGCYFGFAVQELIKHGERAVERYLATLCTWFPDSVYVEVQNHNIDHGDGWSDESVAEAMVGIADRMGLPVVLAQDSHYALAEEKELHESLKQLVAFGPDPDDAVFPGDGFHLADQAWIRAHHPAHRRARGLEGLHDLLDRHTLSIPVLDSYSYSIPQVVTDPQEVMERRCNAALEERIASGKLKSSAKALRAQLAEEYEVIEASGMAGYMILVAMVTDWLAENKIIYQTRGSAAGSVVGWLLGISNVDPLHWDLRFERFISKDRTKPPDVDLDIAHDRRGELIEWLNTRFTAHQIGTWGKYALNDDEEEDSGGSLLVKYFSTAKKHGVEIKGIGDIPHEDFAMLRALSDLEMYRGMGTNAAGVVLTSTPKEFDTLVPLALMPRGGYVSQYNKKDVEDLGLVKLDVLGSKTLTVLGKCCENLGWDVSELENIPLRDRATYKTLCTGETAGIFQLEGKSSKWGTKSLRPDNIKDVIASMALFRPGVQAVKGDKHYIARKHGKEEVPKRHELIESITKDTYGIMLYQEQVIDLLRALGMGAEDLTAFLKAVKASNSEIGDAGKVIASYQRWIHDQCVERGMDETDQDFLNDAIAGFAEYGFNRSHATVYGLTAYRCAYLVTHHPLEFHAALLAVASGGEKTKENQYLRATRSRGIRVLKPSINISGPTYTVDRERGAIRHGLQSVVGIGEKTASALAALAPFHDLHDLISRVHAPITGKKEFDGTPESLNGTLGKLRDEGLLDLLIVKNKERGYA